VHDEESPGDQQDWVAQELSTLDLGDVRLNKRAEVLLSLLGDKPNVSIPTACNGWAETKAAYRFFANERVTPQGILASHFDATRARVGDSDVVLCVEDTSEIDFSSKGDIDGLGPLNYEARQGLRLHPMLAVTPDRLCHGLLNYQRVIRDPDSLQRRLHPFRPIEEKESIRWRNGYETASALQREAPLTNVIYVADREADFFELLQATDREQQDGDDIALNAGFVIRSQHDRTLSNGTKLRTTAQRSPIMGEASFSIPSKGNRPSRKVIQDIRAVRVTLRAPEHLKDAHDIDVTAVYARERKPPKGQDPICWLLLTSEEVATGEQATQILQWYLCRWQIEIFFRILKSGCKVEELQLEHADRIEAALALYCIIAWRVLWLTMLGRSCPELSCDVVFETEEWQAAYIAVHKRKPPKKPPTLDVMIHMIATFGGFLGRKNDGFPGPQSIWIGLQRIKDIATGIALHRELMDSS
jgi:hypothetical protein